MNPRDLLTDDHASLDKLLRAIEAALRDRKAQAVFSNLDLFWARLAVHIRGEHLHLFPALLKALKGEGRNNLASLAEAESAVATLRADHDFFMLQLASAVALIREATDDLSAESLIAIRNIVRAVESRLKSHNRIEETLIYPLTIKVLSEQEQVDLEGRIKGELMNRPSRFTTEAWGVET